MVADVVARGVLAELGLPADAVRNVFVRRLPSAPPPRAGSFSSAARAALEASRLEREREARDKGRPLSALARRSLEAGVDALAGSSVVPPGIRAWLRGGGSGAEQQPSLASAAASSAVGGSISASPAPPLPVPSASARVVAGGSGGGSGGGGGGAGSDDASSLRILNPVGRVLLWDEAEA
jgi:hypothetical protein